MGLTRNITKGITRGITQGIIEPFDYFIFTVKTDNAGTSNSDQFTFPLISGGSYDFIAKASDGTTFSCNDYTQNTMTFDSGAGTYEVRVYGRLTGWSFNNGGDIAKLTGITKVGIFNYNNEDGAFYGCSNLTSIDATDKPLIKDGSTSAVGFFRNTGITSVDWNLYNFSLITDFTNFLNGVTLTTSNYSQLLILLLEQTLQTSVTFHGGSSKWSFGLSGQSRFDLLSVKGWSSITDGGQEDSTMGAWFNAHNVLKSSANPANGTTISSWKDLSDNNLNAEDATNGPRFDTNVANGEPMLYFDGANTRLDIVGDTPTNDLFQGGGSFICAILPLSDGEGDLGRIFSQSGGNMYLDVKDESGGSCRLRLVHSFSGSSGVWETVDLDININEVNIITIEFDSSSSSNNPVFYINSTTPTPITETLTPSGTPAGGVNIQVGNAAISNKTFDGYMGDLGFFKSIPSSTVREERMNYLATKYGKTLA